MKPASLTTGPLPGHIRRIAVPMSIGFFFNTMYNVVDSYYAGTVSTSALAAMALSFPVFFIIIALSEGIARGASALIANAVGEGDTESVSLSLNASEIFGLFAIIITFQMIVVMLTDFGVRSLIIVSDDYQDPDFISREVDSVAASMNQTEAAISELSMVDGLIDDLAEPPPILRADLRQVVSDG